LKSYIEAPSDITIFNRPVVRALCIVRVHDDLEHNLEVTERIGDCIYVEHEWIFLFAKIFVCENA
jgi:hypothetical protein